MVSVCCYKCGKVFPEPENVDERPSDEFQCPHCGEYVDLTVCHRGVSSTKGMDRNFDRPRIGPGSIGN